MIQVHYFASVREQLGRSSEQIAMLPEPLTVATLVARLGELHGSVTDDVLRRQRILVAVNQVVAGPDTLVRDGDEVAFFPPVTGG